MRRARWKRKNVRRVGLRRRRPPAAGGGWLAVPCRSQGRKRPALGEPFGPGKSGIHPAPLFAAAGRWSMRVAAWANATVSVPAGGARSEAERAERGAAQMRPCTPTRSEPPPRDGSINLAEDPSVPEGQAKSEQAPIRRPPCARRATAPECAPRLSLWTVHGPFLFWQDKREMGGASWLDKPPWREPVPRGRRPAAHLSPGGRLPPLQRLPGANFSKSV